MVSVHKQFTLNYERTPTCPHHRKTEERGLDSVDANSGTQVNLT